MAKTGSIANQWQARAADLSRWTMKHMINRSDLWVSHMPPSRQKKGQFATVMPKMSRRGKKKITDQIINMHFQGNRIDHLVGLHANSDTHTARWLGVDISRRGEHDTAKPGDNFQAALDWADKLKSFDVDPLVLDSDGAGGFRLLVIFDQAVDTRRLNEIGRDLITDWGHRDLVHAPHVWPSWPAEPVDAVEHFMRLPGRHPTNAHWSRVWDGEKWLEGNDAVEAILTMKTSPSWNLTNSRMRNVVTSDDDDEIEEVVETEQPLRLIDEPQRSKPSRRAETTHPPKRVKSRKPVKTKLTAPNDPVDQATAQQLLEMIGSLRKLTDSATGGIDANTSAAMAARTSHASTAIDPELQEVIDAWPTLPSAVRAGIMAMVQSNPRLRRA